jgi:hypothetical protein
MSVQIGMRHVTNAALESKSAARSLEYANAGSHGGQGTAFTPRLESGHF